MQSVCRSLLSRLRFILTRQRVGDDSAEELRQHLELLTARYGERGLSPDEARVMAQRQLGNVGVVREDIYWMNSVRWFETLQQDLRYACRLLWHAKAFAGAAVLTLALGVAGTTVMFALIQGVLLRPLPVHEQDRLVVAWKEARTSDSARYPFGNAQIEAIAEASQLLVATAGVTRNGVGRTVVTHDGHSSYANVGLVTGGFFDVLGVHPILGRTLTVADQQDGAESVIVISNGVWLRQYGGARDVVGRRVTLGETASIIVGVMPPDLDYPTGVEIWRTTSSVASTGSFRDANAPLETILIGRLRAGASREQATSEIMSLSQRLDAATPANAIRELVPIVRPFADVVVGDIRATMFALFGAVGLVLLIACANVANLLLLRGEARRGEMALRSALGAGRARILQQVFAEGLILSLLAGIVGFAVAWSSLQTLVTLVPDGLPRLESIRIDQSVALFALVVVLMTALLASIAPAVLPLRKNLVSPLRSGAPSIAGGSSTPGRRLLVVAQVALAVTVVAAAGVLIRSVLRLQAVELGLPADRLVLLELHLPRARYGERPQHAQFLDEAIAQLEALPAIVATTPVNVSPFTGQGWDVPQFTAEGQDLDQSVANPSLSLESIHPNYFEAFQIPIMRGRAFTPADRGGAPEAAIVSADVAARVWPQEDPIGKRLKMGRVDSRSRWYTVVGVAGHTRYRTVSSPRPTLYLPAAQFQMTATMLAVRSTAPLELITSLASERLAAVAPDVQLMRVTPFADLLARPLARPRFNAFLLGMFGFTALLLSTVGLYAVMAAYVRQRDREIAVRMALGATATTVRRMVAGEASRLAGFGVLIGLGCAIVATRSFRGMLFEVEPFDPLSFAVAGAMLICAAALASHVPLRRAARADIVSVLRSE
ncbi:MAG: ADOP family duplicated permease [Vicinamibacterales bacterium]